MAGLVLWWTRRQLASADPAVRRRAIAKLGASRRAQVAPLLVPALGDGDVNVRAAAAEALDRLGWAPNDEAERAAWLIARARWDELVRLGAPAVEPLCRLLSDADWQVPREAARVLGLIGDRRAAPALRTLLQRDRYERIAAVRALGRLKDPQVVDWLVPLLGEAELRAEVIEALATLADARAVEPLLAWLPGGDVDQRARIARALGRIGDPRALEGLVGALASPRGAEEALRALERIDPRWRESAAARAALPSLLARLAQADTVRPPGAEEAWMNEAARAGGAAGVVFRANHADVRRAAATALGEVGEVAAVEALQAALADPDASVRESAARALARIGTARPSTDGKENRR